MGSARQLTLGIGTAVLLSLFGGTAAAQIFGNGIQCRPLIPCFGTPLDDEIEGTNRSDVIHALGGHDLVYPKDGHDEVDAGADGDTVEGAGGRDSIFGGAHRDCLRGGDRRDTVRGGPGSERILYDLPPKTELACYPSGNLLIVAGDRGDDRVLGGGGHDDVQGGPHDDTVVGGAGWDSLEGRSGDDFLNAAAGESRPETLADALIHCGIGTDRARITRQDPRPVGCERVKVVRNP